MKQTQHKYRSFCYNDYDLVHLRPAFIFQVFPKEKRPRLKWQYLMEMSLLMKRVIGLL